MQAKEYKKVKIRNQKIFLLHKCEKPLPQDFAPCLEISISYHYGHFYVLTNAVP